jgi:hypothetical protein
VGRDSLPPHRTLEGKFTLGDPRAIVVAITRGRLDRLAERRANAHDFEQPVDFAVRDLEVNAVDDAEVPSVVEGERVSDVERVRRDVDAEVVEVWRLVQPVADRAHAVRV